jgi:hypothetical protein
MQRLLSLSLLACLGCLCAWAGIDRGLLALAPSGVNVVGSIDVTKSRGSDFGQYLLMKQQVGDHGFEEMIVQTGFDPRRDLEHVLFTSMRSTNDARHSSFAIFARGTFDEERIKAAATAKNAKVENYQGVSMFVNRKDSNPTAFAFLDTGVAVLADLPTLQQIIANRTAPVTLNPELASRIEAVGSDNDAWFVSLDQTGALAQHMLNEAGPQAQAFKSVTQSSGGIRFGQDIQASFQATTRSPQDANALADVIRFLASMVQMQSQEDPRAAILAPALNSMSLATAGNTVHFSVSIPEKSLEQLAELRPRHAHSSTQTQ